MICLDSNCIIDFLQGKKEAVEVINKNKDELATTEINEFEVFAGIYLKNPISEKEQSVAKIFFDSVEILSFEQNCGEIAAKLFASLVHKGAQIEQNDCFIASIMINNGINKIITRNEKHFSRIKEISVVPY